MTEGIWCLREKERNYVTNVTYIPGVLQDLGFAVVPLLVHHINLCMHVLTELLCHKK